MSSMGQTVSLTKTSREARNCPAALRVSARRLRRYPSPGRAFAAWARPASRWNRFREPTGISGRRRWYWRPTYRWGRHRNSRLARGRIGSPKSARAWAPVEKAPASSVFSYSFSWRRSWTTTSAARTCRVKRAPARPPRRPLPTSQVRRFGIGSLSLYAQVMPGSRIRLPTTAAAIKRLWQLRRAGQGNHYNARVL